VASASVVKYENIRTVRVDFVNKLQKRPERFVEEQLRNLIGAQAKEEFEAIFKNILKLSDFDPEKLEKIVLDKATKLCKM
jgi:hypothetical protein